MPLRWRTAVAAEGKTTAKPLRFPRHEVGCWKRVAPSFCPRPIKSGLVITSYFEDEQKWTTECPEPKTHRLGIFWGFELTALRVSFEFRAGMPDCLHWFYSDNEEKASRRRIGENIAMEFDSPMLQQLWAEWLSNVASRIIYSRGCREDFTGETARPARAQFCPQLMPKFRRIPSCRLICAPLFSACFNLARTLSGSIFNAFTSTFKKYILPTF